MIKAEIYSRQKNSCLPKRFQSVPYSVHVHFIYMLKLVRVEFKQLYRDNSRSSYNY